MVGNDHVTANGIGSCTINRPTLPTFIMTQQMLISLEKMRISSLWLAISLPAVAGLHRDSIPPVDEAVTALLLPRLLGWSVYRKLPLSFTAMHRGTVVYLGYSSAWRLQQKPRWVFACLYNAVMCTSDIRLSGLVLLVKWRLHPFVVEHVWQSWTCHKTHHPHVPSWGG